MSLAARHLEANGISTVIMGCAKDIVEHAGVPRFVFSDFPLGNSAGRPFDLDSQRQTLELALRVLESAPGPRTTVQSPQRWNDDARWKLDYLDLAKLTPEALTERRKEFEVVKGVAKAKREDVGVGKRDVDGRPGSAGAPEALGGLGGHVGAPQEDIA